MTNINPCERDKEPIERLEARVHAYLSVLQRRYDVLLKMFERKDVIYEAIETLRDVHVLLTSLLSGNASELRYLVDVIGKHYIRIKVLDLELSSSKPVNNDAALFEVLCQHVVEILDKAREKLKEVVDEVRCEVTAFLHDLAVLLRG